MILAEFIAFSTEETQSKRSLESELNLCLQVLNLSHIPAWIIHANRQQESTPK